MRKDMAKVVTEQPRAGGGIKAPKGENRKLQRLDMDEWPRREKIRRKWKSSDYCKEFTDVLGPLRRWLKSKVGERWDDVYSEICKTLPANSLQGQHIRDHIGWEVETQTILIEDVVCYRKESLYGTPVNGYGQEVLYVHPTTGILCKTEKKPRKKYYRHSNLPKGIKIDEKTQLHKVDGIWYEVQVAPAIGLFPARRYYYYDSILKKSFNEYDLKYVYQGKLYGISKKQLNKKELKKYNLRND